MFLLHSLLVSLLASMTSNSTRVGQRRQGLPTPPAARRAGRREEGEPPSHNDCQLRLPPSPTSNCRNGEGGPHVVSRRVGCSLQLTPMRPRLSLGVVQMHQGGVLLLFHMARRQQGHPFRLPLRRGGCCATHARRHLGRQEGSQLICAAHGAQRLPTTPRLHSNATSGACA